ncbi:MAG: transglutaminase domain-containing [Geobacteraceae bacterium]|nr:MAG: transglutaminase domain-containing [Geobacteraceae bacterium]
MYVTRIIAFLGFTLFSFITTPQSFARTIPPLAKPPIGERWFSISMNDERVGFGHVKITPTSDGYEISGEGSVKMLVLGFSREASARESYIVKKDLSLKSFAAEQIIDGSPLRLSGRVTAKGVRVTVESTGSKTEKTLKVKGAVYPSAVLNLYPLMQGVAPGKVYRLQMLDIEAVKIKEVNISAEGFETLPGDVETVHLRNDLYTFVDNDVWVDLQGNTVKESVRDGLIVTRPEDEGAARRFILEAAVAKKDLILDFSLIRVDRPIERPLELKGMAVELSGFPGNIPLLQGPGQKAMRVDGGRALFTLASSLPHAVVADNGVDNSEYVRPTERILSDNPAVIAIKTEVLGADKEPSKIVEKLVRWVADYVEDTVTDSQSPLETLKTRKGNCQSHARLYASLARAAGIPTRFVSGLVYATGKGFLYHSWAESYVGVWVAVDPTFGQIPADATHVKLVEGDSPEEMAPLAGIIGRVKAKVIEQKY